MTHPSERELALYAGGDLEFARHWGVRWHLRRCDSCSATVESFAEVVEAVRAESGVRVSVAQHVEGLDWDRRAAEMTANISLGLEAGACVGPASVKRARLGWKTLTAGAALASLLFSAWFLQSPLRRNGVPRQHLLKASQIELRNQGGGIELRENGSSITLLHSSGPQIPVISSTPGRMRARFIDEETGQVTINYVYAE